MMKKTRVKARITEAVIGKKSHNRSQDLVKLTQRYNEFREKLRGLVQALKAHHASINQIATTRLNVSARRNLYRITAKNLGRADVYLVGFGDVPRAVDHQRPQSNPVLPPLSRRLCRSLSIFPGYR